MPFYIKQNDTVPSLRATLENGSGDAVDLGTATVRFHMRTLGTTTALIDEAAQVITASSGVVQYNWASGNTATVGSYQAEFEVNYSNGTIETFPSNGYIRVEIIDDIT